MDDTIGRSESGAGASARETFPQKRLSHVDGLRAFCALFVVVHHSWLTPFPAELHIAPKGLTATLTSWLVYGRGAVACFIVISGFCLALPFVGDKSYRKVAALIFYKRRFIRICPTMYAGAAITLLLTFAFISDKIATHWTPAVTLTMPALLANLFLVQNFYHGPTINHAYWSIGLECQIYVLFPLLIWLGRKSSYWLLLVFLLPITYLVQTHFEASPWESVCPHFACFFVLGIIAADMQARKVSAMASKLLGAGATILSLATLAWLATHSTQDIWSNLILLDIATATVMFCVLVAASHTQSWLAKLFAWFPLVWVGEFSYSLYLVHAPLVEILWRYAIAPMGLPSGLGFAILALFSIVGCIIVARVFFEVVEKRFLTKPMPAIEAGIHLR